MKGGPKCRKWGGLGWLGVTQGYGENVAMFVFKINRNYASILYRFRDTVSYLSNVAEFNLYPNCVWRPRWGVPRSNLAEIFGVLSSQPAGDVSHKPGGRLPLLSARPAVTLATLKRAATHFAAGE